MAITQPKRLSYTRRDLTSLHADVDRYIREFIPRITDTSEANIGRIYLTIIEALIDNLNYSVDQSHLESKLPDARQRKNIIKLSNLVGYVPDAVSPSSVDLTFSLLSGVAGPGGQAVPVFTRCQTTISPIIEFYTTEASIILEGDSSAIVPAIQGVRVIDEVLTSSSDGTPDQVYTIANARTPHELVEIKVDGSVVNKVDDFASSNQDDIDYIIRFDENDFSFIIFGDGEFGKAPDTGSEIKATYVQTVAEQGNSAAGTIKRVVGSIASTVGVNNVEGASGGSESESNSSIKRNAPANYRSFDRAVTKDDYEFFANAVAGVFSSYALFSEGSRTDIYLMPEGGGVASSYLVGQAQSELDQYKIEGAVPVAHTLRPASILISVNVIAFNSRISKSTIKQKIIESTEDNLNYTRIKPGRGFTLSDLSGIYENIDSGGLIDFIDFKVLTRVPSVTKTYTGVEPPDFAGRVTISSTSGYDEYLVQALTATKFLCTKNGTPQTVQGTVATKYTTDNREVSFTIGETGDTFTVGDSWRFKTSKYRDNLIIDPDEFMRLERSTDLVVSVFYPNEYNIATQSAV